MDVFVKTYSLPDVDQREWLRYMRAGDGVAELDALMASCLKEAESCFTPRVCYREVPVSIENDTVDLRFWQGESKDLRKLLNDCDRAVVFAATVGLEIDRLIAKYSRMSPAKALCFQALGTERAEALCDAFCDDVKKNYEENGESVTRRFSPGYGDLPLSMQKGIFRALNCPIHIGVTLNDSLLMSPAKSVTAIMGVRKETV